MTLAHDIRDAREATDALLDERGLSAYAYTLERKDSGWTLRIECGADEGWQVITLPVEPGELAASLVDATVREKLCREWAPHVSACLKRDSGPRP